MSLVSMMWLCLGLSAFKSRAKVIIVTFYVVLTCVYTTNLSIAFVSSNFHLFIYKCSAHIDTSEELQTFQS